MCIEDIRELLKEAEVAVSEYQLKFIYENLENLVVTGSPSSSSSSLQRPHEKACKELDDMVAYVIPKIKHKDCYYCGGSGIVDDFYVHRCHVCDGYGVERKVKL